MVKPSDFRLVARRGKVRSPARLLSQIGTSLFELTAIGLISVVWTLHLLVAAPVSGDAVSGCTGELVFATSATSQRDH